MPFHVIHFLRDVFLCDAFLQTKYRMCIYPCYVAYMNAMRSKSRSKHVHSKLKVSDKTKRCMTQVKDVEKKQLAQDYQTGLSLHAAYSVRGTRIYKYFFNPLSPKGSPFDK